MRGLGLGLGLELAARESPPYTPPAPPVAIVATPSTASIAENASVGTVITTFSVANGSGTYTWFLVDGGGDQSTATTLHDIGGNEAELRVASLNYETFPEVSVSIQINNGVDTPLTQTFVVTVTDVAEAPSGNVAPILIALGMM